MLRSPNQRANQIRRSFKNEEFDWLFDFVTVIVWQLEADILTISRGNSILVLSCFFKVSKYISECRPR